MTSFENISLVSAPLSVREVPLADQLGKIRPQDQRAIQIARWRVPGMASASGATEVTTVQLLEDFAKYFLSWINRWAEDGFEPIGRQWQMRADGIGDEREWHVGEQLLRGSFVNLDEQGRLVMMGSDEVERCISINEYFALGRE